MFTPEAEAPAFRSIEKGQASRLGVPGGNGKMKSLSRSSFEVQSIRPNRFQKEAKRISLVTKGYDDRVPV
jgi:hypothetical protein